MGTFIYTGKVLPTSANFTMTGSLTTHWEAAGIDPDPSIKLVMDTALTITSAVVEVHCESNLFGTENYDGHVQFRVVDAVRAVVDSYAYSRGLGLSVILETVVKPDGIKYNIEDKRPDLTVLVTAFGSSSRDGIKAGIIDLTGVLQIIFSDPLVRVALNDLVSSLTLPQYATINCGRAIEAIRLLITPHQTGDRKQGWAAMRQSLNLDQEYLSFITDQSKGPRHGDMKNIGFPEIRETIERSWIVMNRFLEFKKRGDQRLPLTEFPLLTN
jgi:hypothetical protein